ncbi:MAG: [protein-PII] uridylyltransferase [Acidimicrobiia bacterium]
MDAPGTTSTDDLASRTAGVIGDRSKRGSAFARALASVTDGWLQDLFASVVPDPTGVALLAVGGYGRAELCPGSDLDLVLVHRNRRDIGEIAQALWYPIWDQRVKLGHAVRTMKEAISLAADDLDTATALLDVRTIGGAAELGAELGETARARWVQGGLKWLGALSTSVAARAEAFGELAFLLEPDLKESRGGLRDVHTLRWAALARPVLLERDDERLRAAYEVLLEARVELHRITGRRGDRLMLQEQDGVADALGIADADVLMAEVAAAARTISLINDEVWERVEVEQARTRNKGRALAPEDLGNGLFADELGVHLVPDADPSRDAMLVLHAATTAARRSQRIDRHSLERLADRPAAMPTPWPAQARELLVELLLCGHAAIPVIEALDHRGLWVHLIPEWAPNRSRPQRNAYHRFTVDRHLWEAAAEAARLVDRVGRPDLLVLGALLHDIGKGYPGDHSHVGMDVVSSIGARLGLAEADLSVLVGLVEHHLLLPDIATRRDLDDDGTIAFVARAVGDHERLDLLWALTEADSIATGPSAWGDWKAQLVALLVERTHHWLDGHLVDSASYPTPELIALMRSGHTSVQAAEDVISVVAPDRPGVFGKVASVLSLHGLDIRDAMAGSDGPMACNTWHVSPGPSGRIPWDAIRRDVELALRGRLAVDARLAERAQTYRPRKVWTARPRAPRVSFDNAVSEAATVIEVQAADAIGLLARVTRALADLELDIRRAMVQTLGGEVVDTFYVCDTAGEKITDANHLREISRAVHHALATAATEAARQ